MNEKEAIISSMNLYLSSDDHSLDIALKTENEDEYRNVWDYYERYIKTHRIEKKTTVQVSEPRKNWKIQLDEMLEEALKLDVYLSNEDTHIQIQAGNRYEAFISNDRGNSLRINGVLSHNEFEYLKIIQASLKHEL